MDQLQSYLVKEFLLSNYLDSTRSNIGEVEDFALNINTFKITKFIFTHYLKSSKFLVVEWPDIDNVRLKQDNQKELECITLNKQYDDFPLYMKSEILQDNEVLFFEMKKFFIIDKFGMPLNHKIIDFIIGPNEYSIVTDKDLVIADTYVHSLQFSDKTIITMLTEKQLLEFKFGELEEIRSQLHSFDLEKPDYNIIDNVLEMGYSLEVLTFINNFETKNITKTIRENLLFFKGKIETYFGEFDKAKIIFNNLDGAVNNLLLGKVKLEIGKLYLITGNIVKSKELLDETDEFFTSTYENEIYKSLALNWLGLCYLNLGNLTESMNNFQKALEIAKKNKNIRAEAFSMNNIGGLLRTQGKIDEAIEILDEAINLAKDNSIRSMSLLLRNQAKAYYETGNQSKSLELHFDALALRRKFGNILEIAESLLDIALVENSLGKKISILKYFTKPMNKLKIIVYYKNVVLGLIHKLEYQNYDEAIAIWESVLNSGSVGLEYQAQIYDLIIEAMILNITEKNVTNKQYIQEVILKITFAVIFSSRNSLVVLQCKALLGLAKMLMYINSFESALSNYKQALTIAVDNELYNFNKVINADLKNYIETMKTFTELKDEELAREKVKWMNSVLFNVKYLKSYNIF